MGQYQVTVLGQRGTVVTRQKDGYCDLKK